jgi:hypothetical protein
MAPFLTDNTVNSSESQVRQSDGGVFNTASTCNGSVATLDQPFLPIAAFIKDCCLR